MSTGRTGKTAESLSLLALAFVSLIAAGSLALADVIPFEASLSGASEAPPNDSAAKGGSVPISPGSQQVSVSITVVYAA